MIIKYMLKKNEKKKGKTSCILEEQASVFFKELINDVYTDNRCDCCLS
jgi:hypothetical protein